MDNTIQHEAVESAVVNQLSNANVSKGHLSQISKSIAFLQRSGFHVVDWTIFGTPAFEKIVLETQLPAEKAAAFQNLFGNIDAKELGSSFHNFKEIFIYRKGIPPMPNFFNVKVSIENR